MQLKKKNNTGMLPAQAPPYMNKLLRSLNSVRDSPINCWSAPSYRILSAKLNRTGISISDLKVFLRLCSVTPVITLLSSKLYCAMLATTRHRPSWQVQEPTFPIPLKGCNKEGL